MHKLKEDSIIIGIIFSVLLAFCFVVLSGHKEQEAFDFSQSFNLENNRLDKIIELPYKGDYTVVVKYKGEDSMVDFVRINTSLAELKVGNTNKGIVYRGYYLPKRVVNVGANKFEINFHPIAPVSVSVRIRNFIIKNNRGDLIFTLKNAVSKKRPAVLSILFCFMFIFLIWKALILLGVKFFNFSFAQSLFVAFLSFFFCALFLLFFAVNSLSGPYALVIGVRMFYLLIIITLAMNNLLLSLCFWVFANFKKDISDYYVSSGEIFREAIFRFKQAAFTDKLLILFTAAISFCALMLFCGLNQLAERMAVTAYFLLAFTVFLKLGRLIKK